MDTNSDAILREPPVAGTEIDTLLGALERQRRYVAWKCGNLDSAGRTAADDRPEQLMSVWQDAVGRPRTLVTEALADGGLDHPATFAWPDGRTPSLRRLIMDMIEEYGRHVGHADLIRESVDGLVGEDPE
jgi:Protein of unknown function (DUF664)